MTKDWKRGEEEGKTEGRGEKRRGGGEREGVRGGGREERRVRGEEGGAAGNEAQQGGKGGKGGSSRGGRGGRGGTAGEEEGVEKKGERKGERKGEWYSVKDTISADGTAVAKTAGEARPLGIKMLMMFGLLGSWCAAARQNPNPISQNLLMKSLLMRRIAPDTGAEHTGAEDTRAEDREPETSGLGLKTARTSQLGECFLGQLSELWLL